MQSEPESPPRVGTGDAVLSYASPHNGGTARTQKALCRVLLLGGVLLVICTVFLLSMVTLEDPTGWAIAAAACFAGGYSLWLRRQVRLEHRRAILIGAWIVWGYFAGFGCFVTYGMAHLAASIESAAERLVMFGVLGSLFLSIALGVGAVGWGLARLYRQLKTPADALR